jgi:F-type H+-transporting ATPase subunit b
LKHLRPQSRLSNRVFWFVFLAVIAAGVASAPLRIAAQQSASAKSASQGPAAQSAAADSAKPEAASKPEQSEEDGYLLNGPVVKWTARALNVDIRKASNIFVLFNFAIIVLGIGIPVARIMPKFIRKRSETLRENIASARKATEEANARLSAVEAKLASLDDEIAKFRAEVEGEMKQDETRIKSTIVEESARIVTAAEQEIGVAAAQARRALRNFAAELAVGQAVEQVGKQLAAAPETDRALIAEFVGDMSKGGKN